MSFNIFIKKMSLFPEYLEEIVLFNPEIKQFCEDNMNLCVCVHDHKSF